jgi:hypothetical protein
MEIRNKARALGRTAIPYAVILIFLSGVWYFWNDTTEQDPVTREMKCSEERSSPLFYGNQEQNANARLVCSVAGARRTKPLPDLFASTLGPQETADTADKLAADKGLTTKQGPKNSKKNAAEAPPQLCGSIETDGRVMLILSAGGQTRTCAVGEAIAGWRVAYVNDGFAGLEKAGAIIEIAIQRGF